MWLELPLRAPGWSSVESTRERGDSLVSAGGGFLTQMARTCPSACQSPRFLNIVVQK